MRIILPGTLRNWKRGRGNSPSFIIEYEANNTVTLKCHEMIVNSIVHGGVDLDSSAALSERTSCRKLVQVDCRPRQGSATTKLSAIDAEIKIAR